jgi:hypothetical protein
MLENGYVGEVLPEVLFEYRARPGSMYSNTTKPSNYERLCREIARRHLRAYTDYAVDVLALKARQFIELVQLRSEERAYAEKEISRRERTIADQVKTISVINEAKNWLEGQAGSWQRAAEEGARAVQQLQQHAAGLWRQLLDARVEVEDLQRDKARLENRVAELEEQVADLQRQLTHTRVELARARLGRVRRGLRSASLLATPAMPLNARVRHLWWWWKMRRSDKCRRAWNELFDPDWYLDTHYDVGISGVAAELHYILVGHLENRSPSPRFDAAAYLAQRPDVRNAGVNPLLHYVLFGRE